MTTRTSAATAIGALMVREAEAGELGEVGELTRAAYVADRLIEPDHAYASVLEDGHARARTGTVLVAVADGDPRILGTVTVAADGSELAEVARAGELELRMLAVRPDARRHGVAEQLVLAAQRFALRDRLGIVLSTMDAMHAAHRLYARLGFHPDPGRDWHVVGLCMRFLTWRPPEPPGPVVEAATWPALDHEAVDGFDAGFSAGVTRRANSAVAVRPVRDPHGALDELALRYAAHDLPLIVRAPGAPAIEELDRAIGERGLRTVSWTDVLVRDLPASCEGAEVLEGGEIDERFGQLGLSIAVAPEPDDGWLRVWRGEETESARDAARKVMTGVDSRYLAARRSAADGGGETVAIIRVAVDRSWAAISCLTVTSDARRLGLGRALTVRAFREARELGANRAFLQVNEDNAAAHALYTRLGFELADRYRYCAR